jgi:RimJ/RimL family protein N-acetyltransferase
MRTAVLSLAFDHLGALAAVTSARPDNGPSLGVSRRLGYQDNGVSLNASSDGLVLLHHLRLAADEWQASQRPGKAKVTALEPCLRSFGLGQPG